MDIFCVVEDLVCDEGNVRTAGLVLHTAGTAGLVVRTAGTAGLVVRTTRAAGLVFHTAGLRDWSFTLQDCGTGCSHRRESGTCFSHCRTAGLVVHTAGTATF